MTKREADYCVAGLILVGFALGAFAFGHGKYAGWAAAAILILGVYLLLNSTASVLMREMIERGSKTKKDEDDKG